MIARIPIAARLALAFAGGLTVVGVGAVWWVHDQQEVALLRIADLNSSQAEQLGDILRDHLLIGVLTLIVVGTLIAWALIAAALRPVEQLRAAAQSYEPDSPRPTLGYQGADDQIARLARTFEDLMARQSAHVAREQRLLVEAGHELRTPVTAILLEVELALEAGPSDAMVDTLRSIEDEARNLITTADQLLELARDGAPLPRATLDVAALVRERTRQAERRFALEEPIEVAAPDVLDVLAHRAALIRTLDNLLDNAVLHGTPPVRVTVEPDASAVRICVFDAGSVGDARGLFAPFARGPAAASGTGTGLGLGLARSAMRAMGGDVTLDSREGFTRATIQLSLEPMRAPEPDGPRGRRPTA